MSFYYRYDLESTFFDDFNLSSKDDDFKLVCRKFRVIKNTPKGCWVDKSQYVSFHKRFILNSSKKKYCYPTQEQALDAYIFRKERQISILIEQKLTAEIGLRLAKKLKKVEK